MSGVAVHHQNEHSPRFESNRARLVLYAAKQLGPSLRARLDAEDLVQDAFLELMERHPDTFERDAELVRRMRFLIRHRAIDYARLAHEAPGDKDSTTPSELPAPARSPSAVARANEHRERIVVALENLPAIYRDVLSARYLEGRSVQVIARAHGRKPDTVSQQLRRGVEIWRSEVGSDPTTYLSIRLQVDD